MPTDRISRLYASLVELYPESYRARFAEPMRQTFDDVRRFGDSSFGFYCNAFASTALSIAAEHLRNTPGFAALTGLSLFVPFFVLNWIVSHNLQPYMTWLRPDTHTSLREMVAFAFVLFLMPAGAWLSFRPLLSQRRIFLFNALIALALMAVFTTLFFAVGEELYRCEVLGQPNCD